jgi:hypothetical protein
MILPKLLRSWPLAAFALLLTGPLAAQLTPLGSEFPIYQGASSHCPEVAMGPEGDFVVAWCQPQLQSAIPFGSHFDAQGRRLEQPVPLGSLSSRAALAALPEGGYLVTDGRQLRRFDAQTAPGRPVALPSLFLGQLFAPRNDGGFLVLSRDDQAVNRSVSRLYDAEGRLLQQVRFPQEFTVLALGGSGDGGFVVAYRRGASEKSDLYLQRLDRGGRLTGSETLVARDVPTNLGVRISSGAGDRFTVIWGTQRLPSLGAEVQGRVYASNGRAVTGVLPINRRFVGPQVPSAAVTDEQGNTLVVWQSTRDEQRDPGNVVARLFSPGGEPLGPAFQVHMESQGTQACAQVATNGKGRWVITWNVRDRFSKRVIGRLFEGPSD